jgi:hypothetical protein
MKWSILRVVLIILWIGVPIYLWIRPAEYFNTGPAMCPSKLFFDTECFGCGLIRATQHFMHFQFAEGLAFNKLVLLTFPACIIIYFHVVGLIIQRPIFSFVEILYKRKDK